MKTKTADAIRREIQTLLGVTPDGYIGPVTEAAWTNLKRSQGLWPPETRHSVMASSFADPADIAAFRRCKAEGKTDKQCFAVGDNGIGKWGADTTADIPMCALPPEDWKPLGSLAKGKKVVVECMGRVVTCELQDTMPSKANIKNGAGIDLNEAAWKALGHKPPVMLPVVWAWL